MILLTSVTQVGGLVYLLFLFVRSKLALKGLKAFALFIGIYVLFALIVLPLVAPLWGRVALPVFGSLKPLNITTCLLNRHYVTPDMKLRLQDITQKMQARFPGTTVNYLDANFPFFNGFPLIPHLSHSDGKKVDLAFYYFDKKSGESTNQSPSFIGYGAFEGPVAGEVDYSERCRSAGFKMYNLLEVLDPIIHYDKYSVDTGRTRYLLEILATDERISRIFIEPHLKIRWGLQGFEKIRFHGCQAVRHDDHIHMQIF